MTPQNALLDNLTEGELFALDFNAWRLVFTGNTMYYAGKADLLTAALSRIGHPELTALETSRRRTLGDGGIVFVAIPTPTEGDDTE